MIDYERYIENEDFMESLNYLRGNCLLDEDQMIDELDIDPKFIREHFNLIQAIVSEEIEANVPCAHRSNPCPLCYCHHFAAYLSKNVFTFTNVTI